MSKKSYQKLLQISKLPICFIKAMKLRLYTLVILINQEGKKNEKYYKEELIN